MNAIAEAPGPGEFGPANVPCERQAAPERTAPHCPYECLNADGITQFRSEEEGLLLAERILSHTDEAVIVAGARGIVLRVNQAYTRITGYAADEACGRRLLPLLAGAELPDRAGSTRMWQELLRHGCWQGELWNCRKNGEPFLQRLKIIAIRDAAQRVTHHVAIASDISRQQHDGELIDQMRRLDPLTGLPNWELLSRRLHDVLSGGATPPLAVMHLDIDDLKSINHIDGPAYGDFFIQTIAERLVGGVGAENTVARRGGEFCILLHRPHGREAVADTGKRLLALVSEPLPIFDEEYVLTASLGISLAPADGADAEGLLSRASSAMYQAKQEGGNDLRFYSPALHAAINERQAIEKGLRLACERDEFALHYQPQVSMADGRVVGVEALLRWHHPEMGMVAPARFIPIAEETRRIVAIGDWVLREACRQGRAWHDAGYTGLRVAVNLSPRQFKQANLVQRIEDALAESGFAPAALELEITEGALMVDPAQAAEVLRQLKRRGVRFSIDDFGTGYSSLGYLKRFDLDSLKIDRSFIGNCCDDRHDAAIVNAVIGLSHSLGLEVVAEGVENENQLAFVRRAGGDFVQGYLYSPPLAPAALPAVLANSASLRRWASGVPA